MNKKYILMTFIITLFVINISFSQEQIVYKEIDGTQLIMELYYPENMDATKTYPAMIFFFGGGWKEGSIKQFEPHAKYFAKRGLICFLVDYRVQSRHKTSPFESLKDAKSAIRFVREHATKYHVDTAKIIASGGSAGGQLAAAAAFIEGYNEGSDNMATSCKPNALVLFNPVIDNGPGGVGYERIGNDYKNFSPLHNIVKGGPPTIFFLGTKDYLIPVDSAKYYKIVMEKVKSRCDLFLYEGKEHGFFNYNKFDNYKTTLLEADKFLQSLGYLKALPIVDIE